MNHDSEPVLPAGLPAWVVSFTLDAPAAVVESLAAGLSEPERRRADRLRFERDRRRFVVSRARLRRALASRLGVDPDHVEFEVGPHGKPRLSRKMAASGLRFSLSRSNDLAALALAEGLDVGVDIEEVRAVPEADDLAGRIFSARERESYFALSPAQRPAAFLNGWTRKEAVLKARGAGLIERLDRIEVSPGVEGPWTLHSWVPEPGFIGALAIRN